MSALQALQASLAPAAKVGCSQCRCHTNQHSPPSLYRSQLRLLLLLLGQSFYFPHSSSQEYLQSTQNTVFDYLHTLTMGKSNFIRQIENSVEFKFLDKVVNEEVTAQDAVQDLIGMTMSALSIHGPNKHGGIGLPDYNVSLTVMELAQRLEPSQHTKLVEFISHLQKQVAVDPSTNEPLRVQGDILWTDMPSLGYTELETWYKFGGDYEGNASSNLISQNTNAYRPI